MAATKNSQKPKRDVERGYPAKQFMQKLRRLADTIEQGKKFRLQGTSERVTVPVAVSISVEHERGSSAEELELKWSL